MSGPLASACSSPQGACIRGRSGRPGVSPSSQNLRSAARPNFRVSRRQTGSEKGQRSQHSILRFENGLYTGILTQISFFCKIFSTRSGSAMFTAKYSVNTNVEVADGSMLSIQPSWKESFSFAFGNECTLGRRCCFNEIKILTAYPAGNLFRAHFQICIIEREGFSCFAGQWQ